MKKVLLTTLALVSLIMVSGCGKKENQPLPKFTEEVIKANTNEEVIKDQEVNGIKLSNISVVYEKNESILTISITNISSSVIPVDSVVAKYTYEDGKTSQIDILVDTPLVTQQTVYATGTTTDDLTKAKKVEYEIVYSN